MPFMTKGRDQKKVFARSPIFGGSCVMKPHYLLTTVTSLGCHKQPERQIEQKLEVHKEARKTNRAKIGGP